MYELLFTTNEKMKKPEVIEVYADNGQLSHYALVDVETGNKLWSEAPEECEAMGYPVVNNDCIHSVSDSFTANDVQRAYYDGLNDDSDLFYIKNYR